MSSFVDELIDRGYTIDEQLRAYKDRYIAIFAGIKVYVKPTDDSEVIALMELKGTTGVPRLVDSFVSPTVGPVVAVQYVPWERELVMLSTKVTYLFPRRWTLPTNF